MRLDMFLLAESALGAEGKINMLGGGLTHFTTPQLPWPVSFAMVARFVRSGDDLGKHHEIELSVSDPDEDNLLPPAAIPVEPQDVPPVPYEDSQVAIQLVINVPMITVQKPGLHHVRVKVDGALVGEIPLPVIANTAGDDSDDSGRSLGGWLAG